MDYNQFYMQFAKSKRLVNQNIRDLKSPPVHCNAPECSHLRSHPSF